jgi:hypothetical protein
MNLQDLVTDPPSDAILYPAQDRLKEIDAELKMLRLGDFDAWDDLLYERHVLMSGDPNTDRQKIVDGYFQQKIRMIAQADRQQLSLF